MWVVIVDGKPCYWLLGDAKYSIGRKDTCDMIILEDSSISREHALVEVGMSRIDSPSLTEIEGINAAPHVVSSARPSLATKKPSLRITELSRFGTFVQFLPSTVCGPSDRKAEPPFRLERDAPFLVPSDVTDFTVILGTHGAQFTFSWQPLQVFLTNVPDEHMTKLEHRLARCGCVVAVDVPTCDVVLTCSLEPTQHIVIALCYGKPIVSPAYVEAVLSRAHCKAPLPDLSQVHDTFLPPLDEFWMQLGLNLTREALRGLFSPRPSRRYLFAEVTFVCVQPALFEEVVAFVGGAQGRALLDTTLSSFSPTSVIPVLAEKKAAEASNKSIMQAFGLRHRRHVLLYTSVDELPFNGFLQQAQSELQLQCLEYTTVLRSIIMAQKVVLNSGSSSSGKPGDNSSCVLIGDSSNDLTVATPSRSRRSPQARRTAQPLFDESTVRKRSREQEAAPSDDPLAWRSRSAFTINQEGWCEDGEGCEDETAPFVMELKLPPYPCFRAYQSAESSNADMQSKKFRKQIVPTVTSFVGCDETKDQSAVEHIITSRIAAVDADNLFDNVVGDVQQRHDRFNEFDTADMNREEKKRSRKAPTAPQRTRRAGATIPAAREAPAVQMSAHVRAAPAREVHAEPLQEGPPQLEQRPKRVVDIFAVDALFD